MLSALGVLPSAAPLARSQLFRLTSAALASLCHPPCTGVRRVAAAFVRRAERIDPVVERQPLWVAGIYEAKGEAPAAWTCSGLAATAWSRRTPPPQRCSALRGKPAERARLRARAQAAAQAAARQTDALAIEGAKPVTFPDAAGAAQNVSGIREARARLRTAAQVVLEACAAAGVRRRARHKEQRHGTPNVLSSSALCRVSPGCDACTLPGLL